MGWATESSKGCELGQRTPPGGEHGIDELAGAEGLADERVGPGRESVGLGVSRPAHDDDPHRWINRPKSGDERTAAIRLFDPRIENDDVRRGRAHDREGFGRIRGAADDDASLADAEEAGQTVADPFIRVHDEDTERAGQYLWIGHTGSLAP
jgi:hypothetical protein